MSSAEALGVFSQVDPAYRHVPKSIRPASPLAMPHVHLQWYRIHGESYDITDSEIGDAQRFIQGEIESQRLALQNEVGFVVQHRCASVLILYVCTWRNENEIWETLYHREVAGDGEYAVFARDNTSPTFCVWVVPAVAHESRAWVRYLSSARGAEDRKTYLEDQLSGTA